MASTSKLVYEAKPWLQGATGMTVNSTLFTVSDQGTRQIEARAARPPETAASGISGPIDIGYSRSVSMMFTGDCAGSASGDQYDAAVIGWAKTDETTPIYIATVLAYLTVSMGDSVGISGSTVINNTTYIAKKIDLASGFVKPAELQISSYNDPESIAATTNAAHYNTAIIRIELGWGISSFSVYFYAITPHSLTGGFLYSLA